VTAIPVPLGLLAELTHRCPLQCPYCSNPLDLVRASNELDTKTWTRVIEEAAALGIAHIHLSGGEPLARTDLAEITNAAHLAGLYTNLITSAIGLTPQRLAELRAAGLDHVQVSFQGTAPEKADAIAHVKGALRTKKEAARLIADEGLALTINAVIHRSNVDEVPAFIGLAEELGAGRLEIAHVQYHGWALANRAQLMPTQEQFLSTRAIIDEARKRLEGTLVIDHVMPDYFAERPKACMGGWGRQVIVVTPDGRALPCHAAATIPGLDFANVKSTPLARIWEQDEAFNRFRGTGWMPSPCKGCERAELDWGGCRCQALAITGDASATDPVCGLSPSHGRMKELASEAPARPGFRFRRIGG
jgi:pyrroloquinoline quinone biosynthesis protein E